MSLPPLQSASPSKTSVSHHSSVEPRGVPHFDREYAKQLSLARRGRSASQNSNIESRHSLSRAEQIHEVEHDVDAPNHINNRNSLMEELPLHHFSENIRANVPKLKNFLVSHIGPHHKSSSPLVSPSKLVEQPVTSQNAQTNQGLQTPTKTHSPVKPTTTTGNKLQNSSANKTLPFTSSNDQTSQASSPSHSPKHPVQNTKNANETDKRTSVLIKADDPTNHTRPRQEHPHATHHAANTEVDNGSFVDSIKATLSPEFMLAPWRAAAASTVSANNSMTTNNTNRTNTPSPPPHLSTSTLVNEPYLSTDVNTRVKNKLYNNNSSTKINSYVPDGLENSLLSTTTRVDEVNNAAFQPALSILGSTLATLPRSAVSKLIHSAQSREWLKKWLYMAFVVLVLLIVIYATAFPFVVPENNFDDFSTSDKKSKVDYTSSTITFRNFTNASNWTNTSDTQKEVGNVSDDYTSHNLASSSTSTSSSLSLSYQHSLLYYLYHSVYNFFDIIRHSFVLHVIRTVEVHLFHTTVAIVEKFIQICQNWLVTNGFKENLIKELDTGTSNGGSSNYNKTNNDNKGNFDKNKGVSIITNHVQQKGGNHQTNKVRINNLSIRLQQAVNAAFIKTSTITHSIIDFTKTHLLLLSSPSSAFTSLADTQLHNNNNNITDSLENKQAIAADTNNSNRSVKKMADSWNNFINGISAFVHNNESSTLLVDVSKKENAEVNVPHSAELHYRHIIDNESWEEILDHHYSKLHELVESELAQFMESNNMTLWFIDSNNGNQQKWVSNITIKNLSLVAGSLIAEFDVEFVLHNCSGGNESTEETKSFLESKLNQTLSKWPFTSVHSFYAANKHNYKLQERNNNKETLTTRASSNDKQLEGLESNVMERSSYITVNEWCEWMQNVEVEDVLHSCSSSAQAFCNNFLETSTTTTGVATGTNVLLLNQSNKASESKEVQQREQYHAEQQVKHEELEKNKKIIRTLRKWCDERLAAWERACEERIDRLRKMHAHTLNAARDQAATCQASRQHLLMMSKDAMHRMTSSLKHLIIDDFTTVCQTAQSTYTSQKKREEGETTINEVIKSEVKKVESTDNTFDCATYTEQLKQLLESSQSTPHIRVSVESDTNDNSVVQREERTFMSLLMILHTLWLKNDEANVRNNDNNYFDKQLGAKVHDTQKAKFAKANTDYTQLPHQCQLNWVSTLENSASDNISVKKSNAERGSYSDQYVTEKSKKQLEEEEEVWLQQYENKVHNVIVPVQCECNENEEREQRATPFKTRVYYFIFKMNFYTLLTICVGGGLYVTHQHRTIQEYKSNIDKVNSTMAKYEKKLKRVEEYKEQIEQLMNCNKELTDDYTDAIEFYSNVQEQQCEQTNEICLAWHYHYCYLLYTLASLQVADNIAQVRHIIEDKKHVEKEQEEYNCIMALSGKSMCSHMMQIVLELLEKVYEHFITLSASSIITATNNSNTLLKASPTVLISPTPIAGEIDQEDSTFANQNIVMSNEYEDSNDDEGIKSSTRDDIDDSKRFVSAHSQNSASEKMKYIKPGKPTLLIADAYNSSSSSSSSEKDKISDVNKPNSVNNHAECSQNINLLVLLCERVCEAYFGVLEENYITLLEMEVNKQVNENNVCMLREQHTKREHYWQSKLEQEMKVSQNMLQEQLKEKQIECEQLIAEINQDNAKEMKLLETREMETERKLFSASVQMEHRELEMEEEQQRYELQRTIVMHLNKYLALIEKKSNANVQLTKLASKEQMFRAALEETELKTCFELLRHCPWLQGRDKLKTTSHKDYSVQTDACITLVKDNNNNISDKNNTDISYRTPVDKSTKSRFSRSDESMRNKEDEHSVIRLRTPEPLPQEEHTANTPHYWLHHSHYEEQPHKQLSQNVYEHHTPSSQSSRSFSSLPVQHQSLHARVTRAAAMNEVQPSRVLAPTMIRNPARTRTFRVTMSPARSSSSSCSSSSSSSSEQESSPEERNNKQTSFYTWPHVSLVRHSVHMKNDGNDTKWNRNLEECSSNVENNSNVDSSHHMVYRPHMVIRQHTSSRERTEHKEYNRLYPKEHHQHLHHEQT